jgi:hypothetical protein
MTDQLLGFVGAPPEDPGGRLEFSPAPPDRRGEAGAWLAASALALASAVLHFRLGSVPLILTITLAAVLLSAALISFGNWNDRRSSLTLDQDGLEWRSALGTICLSWDQVREVQAVPAGGGWRLLVIGDTARFAFRSASALTLGGLNRLEYGYPHGAKAAGLIRVRAGLSAPQAEGGGWVARRLT